MVNNNPYYIDRVFKYYINQGLFLRISFFLHFLENCIIFNTKRKKNSHAIITITVLNNI